MARGLLASLLLAALCGLIGGGLYVMGGRRAREPEQRALSEAGTLAAELARTLDKALGTAQAEAKSLSESNTMRAGVATDSKTLRDMVERDGAIRPRPDEIVELFQLTPSGPPRSLLRLPADAPPSAFAETDKLPRPGVVAPAAVVQLALGEDGARAVARQAVTPLYQANEFTGLVVVTVRLDLASLGTWLSVRHLGATLFSSAPAGALRLGVFPPEEQPVAQHQIAVPLSQLGEGAVTLRVYIPRGSDGGLKTAGMAVAVLGFLAVALILLLTGRAPAAPAPAPERVSRGSRLSRALAARAGSDPTLPRSGESPPPSQSSNRLRDRVDGEGAPGPDGASRDEELVAGKYRLLSRLGQGGMAEVFLAQAIGEASFEKRVAIKALLPGFEKTIALDHFLDEARLQAKVSHPNVVQIYDLGRDGETFFIAMEYVEGLDAAALIEQLTAAGQALPLRAALTIAIAACEGLHAAHTAADQGAPLGLIHRDVKPSNVLIGWNGSVKVADFGIAKAARRAQLTQPGQVKGSLAYMAPEQRAGEAIDRRVDVFAMGAVIYELCTGELVNLDPLLAARRGPTLEAGWPPVDPPSARRPTLPQELDAIVFKALALHAQDRHPDCRSLAAELEALLLRLGQSPSASYLADWLAHSVSRPAT